MSNTRNLPNPPGGSITCDLGQLGTIKPRGDGTYDYCCHTMPTPPPSGPTSPYSNLSSGIVRGEMMGYMESSSDVSISSQHGIDCVKTKFGFVAVFDLDEGMQILLDSDERFGGISLRKALEVADKSEFVLEDGKKCYVIFPLAHHRVSGDDNDRVIVVPSQRHD